MRHRNNMYKILAFVLLSLSLSAQKTDESNNAISYIDTVTAQHFFFSENSFPQMEREISSFLKEHIPDLSGNNCALHLLYVKESLAGKHYCFAQTIFNIPVYHSMVKVNILQNKKVVDVVALTFSQDQLKNTVTSADFLFPDGQNLIPAYKKTENHYEILEDVNHNILYYFDQHTHLGKKDTAAILSVFNPDPLSSAQVPYGSPYSDNNNATNTALDAELKWKSMDMKFQNDTFLLENDFYTIKDFDAPYKPVVTANKDTFAYNRSQSGFEDINAYYHICNERYYILGLGLPTLVNQNLIIDPHAWSGAENSSFNEFSVPASLLFGEGGIDDAEDAEVLVHEFGHFVSANAAPLSNSGSQRTSIDEGFGDYLAVSYSKNINTYNWSKVFNWDGNNGSWQGRTAATSKHYPEDLLANKWRDGEMWSSTLMQLNADLGREIADSLILQALFSQSTNTSMKDAANLIIDADTALFGAKHHNIIYQRMYERGFFPFADTNKTTGVGSITILDSYSFTKGTSLTIQLPYLTTGNIYLYDVNGKLIDSTSFTNQKNVSYFKEDLSAGAYFIEVIISAETKKMKLIRY